MSADVPAAGGARGAVRVLGSRYEIGDLIGRGGMATVHAALDTRLGRQVAVKLLRPDLARDPAFQARFRREAQSAAALNHPAVVAVYDTGEEDVEGTSEHVPYIVMERVHGVTARELLDEHRHELEHPGAAPTTTPGHEPADVPTTTDGPGGEGATRRPPAPPTEPMGVTPASGAPHTGRAADEPGVGVELAVTVTAGVLAALAYSHRAGIVHRDIKPANVMLTPDGQVKVMDFGIARALADSAATQTQAVIGTAQYLSPEQARGAAVDARTDLYSTGCLLYELLTGRPPFRGDSAVAVAYQHVSEQPAPPSEHNPHLSPALDEVVLRALAKDPDDRYADAGAFRRELVAAARGLDVQTPAPGVVAAAAATTALPTAAAPPTAATQAVPLPGAATSSAHPVGARPAAEPAAAEPGRAGPTRGRRVALVLLALAALAAVAVAAVLVPRLLDPPADPVPQVEVAPLVGLSSAEARAAVEGEGLVYAEELVDSLEVAEDDVVSQDPEAGEMLEPGDTVTATVSTGPADVQVPDVVEQTESQARSTLESAGLVGGEVTDRVPEPDLPEGAVVSTDPEAGATVEEGSRVTFTLSSGEVEIDDYTGEEFQAARSALTELGLSVPIVYEESDADQNTVVSQSPEAGLVPQGSEVQLTVASPPAPTPSPTEPPTDPEPTQPPTETAPGPAPTTPGEPPPEEPAPTTPAPTEPTATQPTEPPDGP